MATKKCMYCKSDIDKGATICPYCQKKQAVKGSGCVTVIAIAILAALIIPAIGGEKEPDVKQDFTVETSSSQNDVIESTSPEEDNTFTIDEQVLWETDGVKVTAKGIEHSEIFGDSIKILVENNSDKNIRLDVEQVIVNDYMISGGAYVEVSAGNKANDEISLSTDDLKASGIETIGKIECYMELLDMDTYDEINVSDCITIKTSDFDSMDTTNNMDGTVLLEQDGIKIVGKYVDEDTFWGMSVLFYIENNSDQIVVISADDVAVNGFMITEAFIQTVYPGKKSMSNMVLFDSSLEENGVTEINNIELTFDVRDPHLHEIFNSGKINFSVK